MTGRQNVWKEESEELSTNTKHGGNRMRVKKKVKFASPIAILAFSMIQVLSGSQTAFAATENFPTYVQNAVPNLTAGKADIAGSAFVDKDGEFHWMYSLADYSQTDSGGSWIKYNTNKDFGTLNTNWGTTTTYNSYWNKPGTINYKIDETYGIPTPYQDDHNDGIGVWVDPDTGYWYALTNDEYQFSPFASGNPTNNERISTGVHNNRVLATYSTDKGATWQLIGQVATSPWNDSNEAATNANFPGSTWSYGVAGTRFFVDNVNGYFYVLYNNHINWKPGFSNILTYFSLARSPISAKMAEGSWDVWYNGTWTRSALKGEAGWIGSPMGAGSDHNLTVNYTPATDSLTLTGTGMDGSSLNISYMKVPSNGDFTFKDAAGNTYTANTVNGTIKNASDTSLPSVSYSDPALDATITVYIQNNQVWISQENNSTGYLTSVKPGGSTPVFKDTATQRVFLPVNTQYENAFSYNAYSGKYRSVGYDGYVYETDDLGAPDTFKVVGKLPSTVGSYLSQIDSGSLTNQQVSGYSFRTISDLSGSQKNYSTAAPGPGQTYYSAYNPPKDHNGTAISPSTAYTISIGGNALQDGAENQWQFIPVPDEFDSSKNSGFYRLRNVSTEKYLKVSGSTAAATRAMGAAITFGAADADANPSGNGGNGTASGSDQWYLLPVGNATPAYLTPSSTPATISAATNSSLSGITSYRLVNRASSLGVEFSSSQASIQSIKFGAGNPQAMTITPVASNPNLPSVPTGLTATGANMSQIKVSWNSSTGATSYDLMVDGVIVSSVSNTYTHTGLEASSTHTYQVRAKNSEGTSLWSSPISATTQTGIVSKGKPATASSVQTGNEVSNANDGNTTSTRWAAVTNTFPQWWKVDLGSSMNITKLESYWYNSTTYPRFYKYKIEGSNDDVTYTTILDRSDNTIQGLTTDTFHATFRYVRVTVTGSNYSGGSASAYEFNVYGDANPTTDTTPPVTTDDAVTGWQQTGQTVTLTATDTESTVSKTVYSVDGGAFVEGSTIQITDEGVHTLQYYSVDAAGNQEATKSVQVKVDKTGPVVETTAVVTGEPGAQTITVLQSDTVNIPFTITDALSGVARSEVKLDGTIVNQPLTAQPFALTAGDHTIVVTAADNAGNTTVCQYVLKVTQVVNDQPSTTLTGLGTVRSGDSFKVIYGLNVNTANIYAQDITIDYDASIMTFDSVKSVKDGVVIVQTVHSTPGKLRLILASTGSSNAVTGQSQILELAFQAKDLTQASTGLIQVSKATLANELGTEIQAMSSSVSIQVTPVPVGIPGDINGDGRVSIGDLALAAANYGKTASDADWLQIKAADMNGDNRIDITDLAAIASKILN
ncbi:hypothetical protein GC097_27560 [Paenibacillus sp. LMG 31457]|uniref:Uncharacterized protein n=2 Tax=Paenibacillus planticolens TaxID=2654976 RepID=A0ABX1ZV62_9BACL|nr:hypothetical protein [Paenibacillus planticolens]